MEKLSLFPVDFFVFKNPNIDNQALIPHMESHAGAMRSSTTLSSMRNLHDKPEMAELFLWIQQCLNEIKSQQKYDCDQFQITSSWFNRALPQAGMSQNYHRHSMSFFSGIYYLTEGAATIFEDPIIHRTQAQLEVLRHEHSPFEYVAPEPGKLVIFPSWVYHTSLPHRDNYDRYIISFNTMPTGSVNYNLATDSVANIELKNREKAPWLNQ
jgi:uncharacterized protein (TIGR02466 family)